jgi:hypothetical protein
MASADPEYDELVATLDAAPDRWVPDGQVLHHSGLPVEPSHDFFSDPPLEIGEVLTASSTLKRTKRPMRLASRILLCGFVGSLGVAILHSSEFANQYLEALLALLLAWLTWFFTRFRYECSYVGKLGTARLFCAGHRANVSRRALFLYADATDLRTSQTLQYYHGMYTGTSYSFVWTDAEGRKKYKLSGTYYAESTPPKSKSPFHFARSAEIAWSTFLLDRAQEELNKTGLLRFNLGGSDWIAVGQGFLELHIRGMDARCNSDEIAGVSINGRIFEVKRIDAKIGWFSKTGVFQFDLGKMSNAHLFLLALNRLMGYRFS